jgi:hypothetical protein
MKSEYRWEQNAISEGDTAQATLQLRFEPSLACATQIELTGKPSDLAQ